MDNRSISVAVGLSMIAGFAGGAASHRWLESDVVHAQASPDVATPRRVVPGEVEAQRFLLTDPNGTVYGVIGMKDGKPEIELYDHSGKLLWKAPGSMHLTPTGPDPAR